MHISPNAGRVAGSQPMRTAVHITWHGAQRNFGDLTPYLTYEHRTWLKIYSTWTKRIGVGSVADPDPGSGAFLTLDPRSLDPKPIFFYSLMTNFWVKNTIILSVLAKQISFTCSKINYWQFYDICCYKKWWDKKNFPPPLFWCCCWIRYPRSGIRDG